MRNDTFFIAVLLSAVFLPCISPFNPLADTGSTGAIEAQRLVWSRKLDSLDVEKQIKKRSGQSLADLEAQTAALHDSLNSARTSLGQKPQQDKPSTPVPPETQSPMGAVQSWLSTLPGAGLFDRVLLLSGIITVCLGILCLITLAALRSRKKKKKRSRKEAVQYEAVKRKIAAAQNANPVPERPAAPESAVPSVEPPPVLPPAEPSTPTQMRLFAQTSEEIRTQVLTAHRSGIDEKEISRRLHISIDQVALIIKMAKQ